MPPSPSDITTWAPELRYRYEERAGIKEYDGGTPRALAEAEAMRETWAQRNE